MHFSKKYTQILKDLPPELQENAIQYRQLKKIINQIVSELSSIGLSPSILQELTIDSSPDPIPSSSASLPTDPSIPASPSTIASNSTGTDLGSGSSVSQAQATDSADSQSPTTPNDPDTPSSPQPPLRLEDIQSPVIVNHARIRYEVIEHSDRIEPHLRLWVTIPDLPPHNSTECGKIEDVEDGDESLAEVDSEEEEGEAETEAEAESSPERDGGRMSRKKNVLWSLDQKLHQKPRRPSPSPSPSRDSPATPPLVVPDELPPHPPSGGRTHEVVIPLVSDTKFFTNLSTAIDSMSAHLSQAQDEFRESLHELSKTISQTALPASASRSVQVTSSQPSKSDLYSWREIFQLYVEAEVFEHIGEVKGGERSLEECERRLQLFVDQATQRGIADRRNFKMRKSREALDQFIELNLFILNIKKFQEASSEATRKILKKHTKRTALPLPSPFAQARAAAAAQQLSLTPFLFGRLGTTSLPRTLVQAIGETLLPIIPHVDDYACLICTAIAFKPIRLSCGHLFCVRCLVKMQKRNKGDCPMCRAPVVLSANGSNVDWALLNFMQDWFPIEAREKLKANEKEAAEEELIELGIDPNKSCIIM
ncbi:RING-14 protein [Coprinopsis cinerea okayama7|uniref:RING-14 protein n=1 Tax=Coprinopsis cinerea (strain Okayama-7 / 130 / ATCC MYA-4618 / FGSC 9003) TaxID=240176 RepID=A8NNF4_COPC7|nr:RING-14 protein [Coprinopsis cinerea okayama7\|eukprot:XP_001835121.2 RING-14 protein [Coprinopsis cinerea okayama7\